MFLAQRSTIAATFLVVCQISLAAGELVVTETTPTTPGQRYAFGSVGCVTKPKPIKSRKSIQI